MVLFELFASLGLDTTSFKQQADAAVSEGEGVAESVSQSFERIQNEASEADTKLNDLETKSQTTGAIMEGFVQATGEIVQKAVEGIIEFGKQSIEAAAATGSELANSFNRAKDSFDLTMDALRIKAGNVLLPIAEGFYGIVESLSGVSDAERLDLMLSRIQEYEFSNIQQLRESLNGVFGMFEEAGTVEAANIVDMTAGLESQAAYWMDYADTLDALRRRNIDPQFLADIADGTAESLETLKALEAADTKQLEQLMAASEAVEETKGATVEAIRDFQIGLDEDLLSMTQSVEELVAGMNQEDAARANVLLTKQGIDEGMSAISGSMSSWVNSINSKLAQIGAGYSEEKAISNAFLDAQLQSFSTNEMGLSYWQPKASGLGYVPYDGYRAELHRGEEVLTRQQAEEDRAGRANNADNTAVVEEIRSLKNAILGLTLTVDRQVIGRIASEEIAREAGVF